MSTVSSWAETRAHLVAQHPDAVEHEEGLAFTVRIDAEELTSHEVEVRAIVVSGAPWVEVLGMIGPARLVWQRALLKRNNSGALGVRCLKRGELAFRQTLPQAGLSCATLDEVVLAIAYSCADERRRIRDAQAPW